MCNLVREYLQNGNRSDLAMLPQERLQIMVVAVNEGRRTRAKSDGYKILVNHVKTHCVCLDAL